MSQLPDQATLQRLLEIATEAALAGAAVVRSFLGKIEAEEKGRSGDLVTAADRASETATIEVLSRHCPQIPILAEESGAIGGTQTSDYLWAIDPLDGTTNFAHQYPFFAVSIGLLFQGQPIVGVVADPDRGELFRAAKGLGATRDRIPMQVSRTEQLSRSLLVTGFAYDRRDTNDTNYPEFCYLTHLTQGVRRGGSASIDLAYVACGRLDGYWERGLSLWDIAAGIVLVQEAGGQVSAYDGSPVDPSSGRLVATNGHLHDQLCAALAAVPKLDLWHQPPATWPKVGH